MRRVVRAAGRSDDERGQDVIERRLGRLLGHWAGVACRRQPPLAGDEIGRKIVEMLIWRLEQGRDDAVAHG